MTPVSAAIARHIGIDMSAEGRAARNQRGIAIVIHGAPLSGVPQIYSFSFLLSFHSKYQFS